MAPRLTTFSKLLITFLILALLFFGFQFLSKTDWFQNIKNEALEQTDGGSTSSTTGNNNADANTSTNSNNKNNSTGTNNAGSRDDDNTLKVQLVTWGGYAPGLYFNEGAKPNARSRFYKEYGVNVEFILENNLDNALNGWMADEYDVLVQTADAFPYYTAPEEINNFKPKAFIQVDWSRGGDAIIVKRGIKTINDLKGKRIAVAVPSPAQTLLFSSLEAAGLSHKDVKIVTTSDNLKSAELFRSDDIDAAVVWSPDDIIATRDVAGSSVLLTTKEQSHIIADIMFAKEDVINKKRKQFDAFYEGWMKAVSELRNKANHDKSAKYLAEFNEVGVEDAKGMIETVYWTGHGDNMNFFGLNPDYKGQKGSDLYTRMSKTFMDTGDLPTLAPSWRSVVKLASIQAAQDQLKDKRYSAEKEKSFTPPTLKDKTATPIATKPVKINFPTGQYQLSENAKTIIDIQFANVAKSFGNMKVRVEGNTDNVGAAAMNKKLSEQRAKAVADYLKTAFNISPNRFVVVGNGPNRPVKGCEANATEACRAKNRRTEFQLIPG